MPQCPTINEAAKIPDFPLSAFRMRQLLKQGKLPGFYCGSRFRVRLDLIPALLDELTNGTAQAAQKGT